MKSKQLSGRMFVGATFILLGFLLLLDSIGVASTGTFAKWIPSLLVLYGLWRLYGSKSRRVAGPLILIGLGVFIQLAVLGALDFLWPLVIIGIGLLIITGGRRERFWRRHVDTQEGELRVTSIMSGARRRLPSDGFIGGEVTAFMGSVELDLRGVQPPSEPVSLDVTIVMGGVDLFLPSDWRVQMDPTVLMGGVEDKRPNVDTTEETQPHLRITGLVLMGGLSLKT
jgi:predicted membrane protein